MIYMVKIFSFRLAQNLKTSITKVYLATTSWKWNYKKKIKISQPYYNKIYG